MLGSHLIKAWSSTQPSIGLSSGEAEYSGVVKAAGIAIGQQSLMKDLGIKVGVRVWTDSSAAVGICGSSGLGKLRHVQTHTHCGSKNVRAQEPFNYAKSVAWLTQPTCSLNTHHHEIE